MVDMYITIVIYITRFEISNHIFTTVPKVGVF